MHITPETGDWSKTVLSCVGSTDLSLKLELVHVRTLAMHRIEADLTELVLASTPTLRRLRQRRPEWEARGWLPLETLSGLVLRIPGSACALRVVPSEEARTYVGGPASSSVSSELVAVALPSLDLDAARTFYQEALGMQTSAGGQVCGGQVALSFGTLGPRLLLVACPSPVSRHRDRQESSFLTPNRKPDVVSSGIDYGDLGCSPPWRAGDGGSEGALRNKSQRQSMEAIDEDRLGDRVAGMGVPASIGRLVIGCTAPVLNVVTARATVGGHQSLVPLSSFPGPRGTRLALALLQSPDGHEVQDMPVVARFLLALLFLSVIVLSSADA